jgi:mono/diheme cytochrome c family protein
MRFIVKAGALWLIATLATPAFAGAGMDLHKLWDDRCFECHGHAGDFARKYLSVTGGELQGRHHVDDLRRFLGNHYLGNHEVDAVYDMLLAQASRQARFKNECSGCHGVAATFVRNSLDLYEGVVYGRDSSLPIRMFLAYHRGLSPADVDFYVELLTRVAREIYRP